MCIVELISCYGTLQFSSFVPDCDDDFKPVVAMFSSSPCPDCLLHQMTSLHFWRHVPLSAAPSGGGRQWLHPGGGAPSAASRAGEASVGAGHRCLCSARSDWNRGGEQIGRGFFKKCPNHLGRGCRGVFHKIHEDRWILDERLGFNMCIMCTGYVP
jgi:hypothetical protein